MPTCALVSCSEASSCCLEGGCVPDRFGTEVEPILPPNELRADARALAGTKPRPSRDPHTIKRKRKELTR
jgi:hypothetical protein